MPITPTPTPTPTPMSSDATPTSATRAAPIGGATAVNPAYPTIEVLDMHTGGEPVRIIRGGYPQVVGATILDKRRYVREHLDHLRRLLMFEPHGHADMYGALLVEPRLPEADLAVLFLHNAGYSTMCGHAVIALGRYAVDYGLVEKREPVTHVGIECPCGLVRASVEVRDGKSGRVAFERVRAFLFASRVPVAVSGVGTITADVSYGGAFYALADAAQFGLDVRTSRVRDLVDAATALTEAVRASVSLSHPEHDDLAFLYGSILTDGRERQDSPFGNVDWYRNYSAVSGACQMLRRDVFDQIGGFNEQLEPELSSVDLCLRVLAQGYRNFYTPYARLGYYLRRLGGRVAATSPSRGDYHPAHLPIPEEDHYYNPNLSRTERIPAFSARRDIIATTHPGESLKQVRNRLIIRASSSSS